MLERLSPNRMNLLNLRSQIASAKRGVKLLEDKRIALIKELLNLSRQVVADRQTLRDEMQNAAMNLLRALGIEGEEGVKSAAFAAKREVNIEVTGRNVWGVRFPEIHYKTMSRAIDARGYSFMTVSSTVDEAAKGFERVLDTILRAASTEAHMGHIGVEIKKTGRRINAIREIIIPRTREMMHSIRRILDEREREDILRLKKFKGKVK